MKTRNVCKWLLGEPWFWDWAFKRAQETGAIVFDNANGTWVGAQTERGREVAMQKATES